MGTPDLIGSNSLFHFLLLLAIAGVVVWLNNRFGNAKTRGWLDKKANSSAENLNAMVRIADRGRTEAARPSLDRTIFPAGKGVRLIATALTAGLFLFLVRNPTFLVSTNHDTTLLFVAAGLGLWYLAYIWSYEIEIEGTTISIPTYWFKPKTFDLTTLVDVEDDGAYGYRLIFADGQKPLVLKHVDGQAELISHLDQYSQSLNAGTARS